MKYVLITPAHNEAAFIELTLQSVIAQTKKPLKWIIVDDGSTDSTAEQVSQYARTNPWIELLRLPLRCERHFAGKAHAVSAGRERLSALEYDIIGNLDADVSFEPDYFEFLMGRFTENPRLGVAGTAFIEGGLSYNYDLVGVEHVSGMIQMFRRECFDEIGGYAAIKTGGIDLMAVLSARAKGWETRTFLEKTFNHHRTQGGALHTGLRARWNAGLKDYLLGNHPIWEIFRSCYQMLKKPYVVGGTLLLLSYMWHWAWRKERSIPSALMAIRRRDQISRLKLLLSQTFRGRHISGI